MGEERTVRGFMCKTDFDHELGYASDGNKVYPSEAALRRERACVESCGIVEVEVRLVRVVQDSDFALMRAAALSTGAKGGSEAA